MGNIDTLAHKYMTATFPVLVQAPQYESGEVKLCLWAHTTVVNIAIFVVHLEENISKMYNKVYY